MKKGFLITFEGGEGGGKTTQAARLRERLADAGHESLSLREPGGNVISEAIRDVVLNTKYQGMIYETEVLLFQAARAQIYGENVIPNLEKGKMIIMDRSRDSSVVYQGIVRGFGRELIEQLNDISTQNTVPDLTLLLDVPIVTGLKRRQEDTNGKKMDRLDAESEKFHERVREAYLQLAKEDKTGRWAVIDGSKDIEAVDKQIWQVIKERLHL